MKPVTSPFSQKGEGDVRVKICGLSRRELVERFKLILNDWSVN